MIQINQDFKLKIRLETQGERFWYKFETMGDYTEVKLDKNGL
jgi:hypothetical protein